MAIEPTITQLRVAFDLAKAWRATPRGPDLRGRLYTLRQRFATAPILPAEVALLRDIDQWLKT